MYAQDEIVKVTQEGRNGIIVRLWTRHGNQVSLRPTDPDTGNQADYAVELIRNMLRRHNPNEED